MDTKEGKERATRLSQVSWNLIWSLHNQLRSIELTQEEADELVHTIQQRVRRKE